MSDFISRSALLKSIEGVEVSFYLDDGVCGDNYDDTTIVDIINVQPTIEAVPVVHGEWIESDLLFEADKCTICNASIYNTNGMNFCPNCGADMRKGGTE